MEEEVILRLIDFIERASPAVWEIGMRQVYVSIAQLVIGLLIAIVFTILSLIVTRWGIKEGNGDIFSEDTGLAAFFGALCVFIGVTVTTILLITLMEPLLNPEYAAIKHLLYLVP